MTAREIMADDVIARLRAQSIDPRPYAGPPLLADDQPDEIALHPSAIPALIAAAWTDGDDDDRRKIDRDLAARRERERQNQYRDQNIAAFGAPLLFPR